MLMAAILDAILNYSFLKGAKVAPGGLSMWTSQTFKIH